MLLSFSEPAMLPMIINGLIESRVDLQPGIEDWAHEHFANEFEEAGKHIKWQTIRENTSGHWDKVERGTRLDLWWLNPRTRYKTPDERTTPRKLAVAKADFASPIRIAADGTITVDDHKLHCDAARALAYNDGFGSAEELVAWISAQHGLPFNGKKIAW